MLAKWYETYNLNRNHLDARNQEMIDIINDLVVAQQNGTIQFVIADVYKKAIDYAEINFASEEDIMNKCNYPATAEHIREHNEFKQEILELSREWQEGDVFISLKTLRYLKDWAVTHLLGTDKEFGEYLASKELGNHKIFNIEAK